MPPIKRNARPATGQAARRRLAGHGGPTGPETGKGGGATESGARRGTGLVGKVRAGVARPGKGSDDHEKSSGRTASEAGRAPRAGRGRNGGRTLAYTALGVGLVAGIAGGVLATEPGADVENRAFVDAGTTDEVLAAATTNVQRLVAIDHETLDEYHASLGEFLTPNLVTELEENWPALRDSYEQSATSVDANVTEAGLAHLSGDRAEVLLVQDVSMTRDEAAAGSTSGTYLVGLDKVDGVWKLSRIPDLPS